MGASSDWLPVEDVAWVGVWPLEIGASITGKHIGCSEQLKVTLTRTALGLVYYCHKCARSGWVARGGSYGRTPDHDLAPAKAAPAAPLSIDDVRVVREMVPSDSHKMAKWFYGHAAGFNLPVRAYGVSVGVRDDRSELVFTMRSPILGDFERTVWRQSRVCRDRLPPGTPKWRTQKYYDGPKLPWISAYPVASTRKPIVLCEDIVSALSLKHARDAEAMAAPLYDVGSLNGLTLSFEAAVWLSTYYSGVILIPDKDLSGHKEGMELAHELRPLFDGKVVVENIVHSGLHLPVGASPKNVPPTTLRLFVNQALASYGAHAWT